MPSPSQLIGRSCSFDHQGKKLVGTVIEAKDNGLTLRGAIPDLLVTVRGQSGATLTVSLVESYMKFTDQK